MRKPIVNEPSGPAAKALIGIIGFTPGAVGRRLPSPIQRWSASFSCAVKDSRGAVRSIVDSR